MSETFYLMAEDRAAIAISGEDREAFLQGLVSNDVRRATPDQAIWAAFLTAQGKYLHDFFLVGLGDGYAADCEADRRADLLRRLKMYKLRSKVELADLGDSHVVALLYGDGTATALGLTGEKGSAAAFGGGVAFVDPRLADGGCRAILPRADAQQVLADAGFRRGDRADWERRRLSLGLPDGSRDLPVEKAILLENGFEELSGVDWNKGCYMGQELTARTKYRGLVRKRLMPVAFDGPTPEPGTPVLLDGKDAGETRSGLGDRGLALLRLEQVEKAASDGQPLLAGETKVLPEKPDWASF